VLWLVVYAAAIVGPVALVLLSDRAEPRSFMLELGSALGIAALSLLALQLVLPARLPVLAGIGAEVAVRLHRRLADIMLAAVAAHVAAVMVADPSRLELLRFFGEPWRAQAAIGSVVALVVLVLTSLARRRIRLSYAGWRAVHLVTGALALVLAVVHTIGVGRYLVRGPAGVALAILTLVGIGALVAMRSRILRRRSLRPYEVDSVVGERGGAVTLVLRAVGHAGQPFIPGQFAWLRLAGARTLLAEHPFSYSSSAEDPLRPSFTMQPRSGFSARAATFAPGTRLLVDGPHGAFRPRAAAAGMVLVAGGIGITPSMSVLRTAADRRDPRPHVLVYGARTLDGAPFLDEIETLRGRLRLRVVMVLSSPGPDWAGERGRINAGVFDRHLPHDLRGWQFLVCGSGPFVDGVIDAFEAIGVPGERVHAERFVEV
jgi:predicted ferric reductase